MNSIIINKIIVHYVDLERRNIMYSNDYVNLDSEIGDYYATRLEKSLFDKNKKEVRDFSCNYFTSYNENYTSLLNSSRVITNSLYKLHLSVDEMPNYNIVFYDCNINGKRHIAILKFDHKVIPTNIIEDETYVRLMMAQNITPSKSKANEMILFNIDDGQLYLLETKYLIDDQKEFYLCSSYLKGIKMMSQKEAMQNIIKVINKTNTDFKYSELPGAVMMKYKIYNNVDKDSCTVSELLGYVFNDSNECYQNSYIMLQELGVDCSLVIDDILESCEKVIIKINDDIKFEVNINDYVDKNVINVNADNKNITIKDVFDYKIN